uniref:EOG090X09U7 n=1 Tax=Megafenestra aurita TaxID=2291010 RepID=A0A4Y7NH36_9CRUS|nr:EOG090X09U7 [Megafenestra aurita]SVE92520.1 EOG090X09U7 [Megafenestra aurita]
MANEKEKTAKLNPGVWVIFGSLVIDLIGFTVILPLMPKLLDHYSITGGASISVLESTVKTLQETLNIPEKFNSVMTGGILGSLFSFLQFLASPIAGCLSDCYGRKPALLVSMFGIAASYTLWVVSDSFLIFMIARAVGGVSKANVSLATAVMADITDSATRAKAMALVGVAFAIGFIVGPVTGAAFSAMGIETSSGNWWFWPAIFSLTLTIINIGFVAAFFTESLPKAKRAKSLQLSQTLNLVNPVSLFKFQLAEGLSKKDLEKLKVLGRVYFLVLFFYSGLEYTLTFLTHLRFNYNAAQQGKMLLFVGLLMAFFQGGLVRRVKPGNEKKIALIGLGVIIPSFVIVGLSNSATLLYIGLALYSLGSAIVIPCLTAMTAAYGRADQKGAVIGTQRSLGALARAFGPLASSFDTLQQNNTYMRQLSSTLVEWQEDVVRAKNGYQNEVQKAKEIIIKLRPSFAFI